AVGAGKSGHRSARVGSPARRTLTGEERQHRDAVSEGLTSSERLIVVNAEVAFHPGVNLAAVGKGASHHETAAITARTEEALGDCNVVPLDHGAHCATRSHHQRKTLGSDAAAAYIAA